MWFSKVSEVHLMLANLHRSLAILGTKVRELEIMCEQMCPHLNPSSNLAETHANQEERLGRRLREADIIPEPRHPRRLKMYVFMRKVVAAMPSNNITGCVNGKQLGWCSDELKQRMPEGIVHFNYKPVGGDESDYFVNDAAAQRAAPIIRERTNWVAKGQPAPPRFPSDPVVDEDDFA